MILKYVMFSIAAFICFSATMFNIATNKNRGAVAVATFINAFIIWLLVWGAVS